MADQFVYQSIAGVNRRNYVDSDAKLELLFRGLAPLALMLLLFGAQAHAADVSAMEGLYEDHNGAVALTRCGEFGDGLDEQAP